MSKKINAASKSKEDEELSELLDNSLLDFGKSNLAPPEDNQDDQNVDADGARQAAQDFQKMLQQLADIQKVFVEEMSNGNARPDSVTSSQTTANDNGNHFLETSDDENDADRKNAAGNGEDLEAAQNFLKNIQFLAEKAQKVQQASSEQDFKNAMKDLSDDSTYETEFMPFMHGLMGSLLSKEMLYPPMKEMCEKFPKWINENRTKVDIKTMENYETQLKLMTEICYEYEQENVEDTDKIRADRMDRLMNCMQKIQACGYPPEDLVGSLPPGWALDSKSGLPKAVDMSKAAEACSIM